VRRVELPPGSAPSLPRCRRFGPGRGPHLEARRARGGLAARIASGGAAVRPGAAAPAGPALLPDPAQARRGPRRAGRPARAPGPAMLPAACTLIADQSPQARRAAASRVPKLHDLATPESALRSASEVEVVDDLKQSLAQMLRAMPQQVDALVRDLGSASAEQRARAALWLGRMATAARAGPADRHPRRRRPAGPPARDRGSPLLPQAQRESMRSARRARMGMPAFEPRRAG